MPGSSLGSGPSQGQRPRLLQNLTSKTVAEVNLSFTNSGKRPPYSGRNVREFVLSREMVFMRAHTDGNQSGGWMVRQKHLAHLTAEQIRDSLALPDLPTYISTVTVPRGTRIRVGKVAPQEMWGQGNSWQYQLLDRLPKSAFSRRHSLP